MMPDLLLLGLACLAFCCAAYVLGRAMFIPYELKTDRLWKCGEEEDTPNEPEGEYLSESDAIKVVDIHSRRIHQ
jgi:hypothetical protein